MSQLTIDTGVSSLVSSSDIRPDRVSQSSLLTVEAMLRIKESGDSVASDNEDVASICSPTVTTAPPVTSVPRHAPSRDNGHVSRGQAQLTYLLHTMLEAECLDWACVLAIVLGDTMALVRIISSARSSPELGARLYAGLTRLPDQCPQYSGLVTSIHPHLHHLAPTAPPLTSDSAPPLANVTMLSRSLSEPGQDVTMGVKRERKESDKVTAVVTEQNNDTSNGDINNDDTEKIVKVEEEEEEGCVVM